MGRGLYEAAFAGLVRLYGRDSRSATQASSCLLALQARSVARRAGPAVSAARYSEEVRSQITNL